MFPIKDIMTTQLVFVKSHTPIYEAIEALADNKISGLPVVDDQGKLVGVLSEWDVLELLTDHEIGKEKTVEHYMTKEVLSFNQDDSVVDVCDFFKNENKRRAPIIKDGQLVGIVSRHDVIKLILDTRKKVLKNDD